MNIQSFEIRPIPSHLNHELMTATEHGIMAGGFSSVYSAASTHYEEDAAAIKPTATTNNCHGGNCAAGCGVKQN